MTSPTSFKMAHGITLLTPKDEQAYPILCAEWDLLKSRIAKLADPPTFFHTTGSILVGAAASTLASIVVGALPEKPLAPVIAWSVVVVAGVCGLLCYYFARRERAALGVRASEIVAQMDLMEKRYETGAA